MKKLIQGLLEFQRHGFPAYRETFARLAKGQSPDTLFIGCSDSRVVPNVFASTNPGDLFVMRNVGNLVPPSDAQGVSLGDMSEAAAIEYAVEMLHVSEIVVCGHSSCGAMGAIVNQQDVSKKAPNLQRWLFHGIPALERLRAGELADSGLSDQDRLSQINVLQQLEHVGTYPAVQAAISRGDLRLRAWWFDIARARVSTWREDLGRFVVIDESEGERLLAELEREEERRDGSHDHLHLVPAPAAT